MKKCDLHVHTISTISDRAFTFSLDSISDYVEKNNIDAIAITNHNLFNRSQYEQIKKSIEIKVFPGIEVDIENGHLLVITDESDVEDFVERCNKVFE